MKEAAFGIVPLAKKGGVWNVLLIKHHSGGHWGFPKGHSDIGEQPRDAATRELKEETGLDIKRFLCDEEITERYQFARQGEQVSKSVTYFIAEVKGDVHLQQDEVSGGKWVPLFEAVTHMTFPQGQNVCDQVYSLFDKLDLS